MARGSAPAAAPRVLASLLALFLVLAGAAEVQEAADEGAPACPGGGAAGEAGCEGSEDDSSLLQRRQVPVRKEALEHLAGDEELKEAWRDLPEKVRKAAKRIAAHLVLHNHSGAAKGEMEEFVISRPRAKNCSGRFLTRLGEIAREHGRTPRFVGAPDEGGLCVLIVRAYLWEVAEIMELGGFNKSDVVVEADKKWSLVLPRPGNRTEGADLLQAARGATWGLDRIDERLGLDGSYSPGGLTGAGAHVYVLDTGIRTTHQDFGGRAIPTLESLGSLRVCSPTDRTCAMDRHGHGSHVAGTIGGAQWGVAKGATLHAVKVLADSGSGSFSWFIEAIDWVMRYGTSPKIIGASLGGPGTMPSVKAAIDAATASGVTVVVASGNDGDNACNYSPASVPSAVTVGATSPQDGRASFSNYGACVDILAPGVDITSVGISSDTATAVMSGTSMACPHVAGAAALVRGANPDLSAEQAASVLTSQATPGVVRDPRGSPNKLLYTSSSLAVR